MGRELWAELISQTGLLRNNYKLRIEHCVPKTKPLYSHKTVYKKRLSHQLTLSNALKGHLLAWEVILAGLRYPKVKNDEKTSEKMILSAPLLSERELSCGRSCFLL
jgi:hypothetical protein